MTFFGFKLKFLIECFSQSGWILNPIYSKNGGYPQVMVDLIGNKSLAEGRPWSRLPKMSEDMRKSLIGSSDFLAVNYYTSRLVGPKITRPAPEPSYAEDPELDYYIDEKWTRGKSTWLYIVPDGLHDVLMYIKNKYDNPEVMITENGIADDGEIDDQLRINYYKSHIAAVLRAKTEGCNVTGYTVWSIIDNFEWGSGFTEMFGIYSVDVNSEDKERIKKSSADFIEKLIKRKGFYF